MYSAITSNKRKTWLLILLVSGLIIGLSLAFGALNNIDPGSSVIMGLLFATIYSIVSYFIADKVALSVSGAAPISKQEAPELWNIVENLCIANGQPLPKLYIINDPAPNAFATGRDPEHSSLAFTTGLLALLNKQELEGVAAHELSHVKNYDIRVMTIAVVLVGAVLLLSDLLLHGNFFSRRDKEAGGAGIMMIIGLLLAILSPIFGELLKLAISRNREYLADASAALLTRYPEGLASALAKISASSTPLKNANQATAHLYISNPFGKTKNKLANLFSTHPPAEERIKKLRAMI